jgi:hypothetical protein
MIASLLYFGLAAAVIIWIAALICIFADDNNWEDEMDGLTCVEPKEQNIFQRLFYALSYKFQCWRDRNEPGALERHAIREFKAAGYIPLGQDQEDGPDKWMQEGVLELIRVFGKQGHSGFSAPHCISLFKKLANYEPLIPLSGDDEEWNDISDGSGETMFQNNRCSHVFKGADGKAYDIDGRIFREPNGACYTSRDSRVYVEFPYAPKSEYVDVAAKDYE